MIDSCVRDTGLQRHNSGEKLSSRSAERPEGQQRLGKGPNLGLHESTDRRRRSGISYWCRQAYVASRYRRYTQQTAMSQHFVVSNQHHAVRLPGSRNTHISLLSAPSERSEWRRSAFSFDVCLCLCVHVRSGPVSQTSLKRLKLRTSNLTRVFPGDSLAMTP